LNTSSSRADATKRLALALHQVFSQFLRFWSPWWVLWCHSYVGGPFIVTAVLDLFR